MEDLSRLEHLPPDRVVRSLAVGGNKGEHKDVIVKFAFENNEITETVTFLRKSAIVLVEALRFATEQKNIPEITKAEREKFVELLPSIEDYDWNLQGQKSRVVGGINCASTPTGLAFEFVMMDETARQFLIPPKVARFLAEYLYLNRGYLGSWRRKGDKS